MMKKLFLSQFLVLMLASAATAELFPTGLPKLTYGAHKNHRVERPELRLTAQKQTSLKPKQRTDKRVVTR